MTETKEKSPDYLEVDNPLPGQDWVCMSFISPESMIESKESFKVSKFLESFCKDKELNYQKCMAQYNDFTYKFSDELQKDYDKKVDFKNNIRGVKVRGVFSTRDEADNRAKKLQVLDSDFHVFVGQVGYWLPWDPCADKIENEHFLNDELNEMMVKYKENNVNKDIFYEDQKREKLKEAKEESIRKNREKNEVIEECEETNYDTGATIDDIKETVTVQQPEPEPEPEPEQVPVDTQGLDEVDPWMARKQEQGSGS